MAYYAFLDENNIVTEVISGKDETDTSENWELFYGAIRNQNCKRTSYNTRHGVYYSPQTNSPAENQSKAFRKNYAGIGYTYDETLDAFIPPKPFPSWLLDNNIADWIPPTPMPDDGHLYYWDEATQTWKVIE